MNARVYEFPVRGRFAQEQRGLFETAPPVIDRQQTVEGRLGILRDVYLKLDRDDDVDVELWGVAAQCYRYALSYANQHPEVGMSMTRTLVTDRHAYVVTRVSASGKTFWARRLRPVWLKGSSSPPRAYVETGASEEPFTYREAIKGFKRSGDRTKEAGGGVQLGVRDAHWDPEF